MTKKHFIALADKLRDSTHSALLFHLSQHHPAVAHEAMRIITEDLATFCQSQNPRFNRERWIAYINGECGPSGGKVK